MCVSCNAWHHFKCSSESFELSKVCRLCCVPQRNTNSNKMDFGESEVLPNNLCGKLNDITYTRGLKMLHLNIRSLVGKVDELRSIFTFTKSTIHLLTLSETWLSADTLDSEIEISGYNVYRRDRKTKGGGVAVYIRNDICAVRTDLESSDVEALWLQVFLPKSHSFLIGTFYRPPNSSKTFDPDFVIRLDSMVDSALADSNEVILFGDFNCDFLVKRSASNITKQLKLLFKAYNFTQLINEPTRAAPDSVSLLDLIVTNRPSIISHYRVV